jgi:hypothetical protein
MNERVLIYMRGGFTLREHAWALLQRRLIESADSLSRHEAFLKDGKKGKMGANEPCMIVTAQKVHLGEIMAYLRDAAGPELSAHAVPVLASV